MKQTITLITEHGLIQGDILKHVDVEYVVVCVNSPTSVTVRIVSWWRRLRMCVCRWIIAFLGRWA